MQKKKSNIAGTETKSRKILFSRTIFYLLLIIIASGNFAWAQRTTNSPYSFFGIGELERNGFGRNEAMGGTGIALRPVNSLNNVNPASYSQIPANKVIFETGLSGKYSRLSDKEKKERNYNGNLAYMAIGFQNYKWWAMSFGFTPLSSVGYKIKEEIEEKDVFYQRNSYQGSGGLSRLYWSHSFQPVKYVSIGAQINYLFGKTSLKRELYYTGDGYISETLDDRVLSVKDFSLSYGMQLDKIINSKYRLIIGAVFENDNNLKAREKQITLSKRTYDVKTQNERETQSVVKNDTISKGTLVIPQKMGFGVSFGTRKFLFTADYYTQKWSASKFFGEQKSYLSDTKTLMGGIEYTPGIVAQSYWKVVRYRLGFRHEESYLEFDNAGRLKETAVSFGASFPLKKNSSIINLAFEFGKYGTTDFGLIEKKYIKMTLNFSIHDMWFIKRKFD